MEYWHGLWAQPVGASYGDGLWARWVLARAVGTLWAWQVLSEGSCSPNSATQPTAMLLQGLKGGICKL